jgi:hypothetical protein
MTLRVAVRLPSSPDVIMNAVKREISRTGNYVHVINMWQNDCSTNRGIEVNSYVYAYWEEMYTLVVVPPQLTDVLRAVNELVMSIGGRFSDFDESKLVGSRRVCHGQ